MIGTKYSPINKLESGKTRAHIIKWFNEKRKNSDMEVKEIDINELEKWDVDEKTGNIAKIRFEK